MTDDSGAGSPVEGAGNLVDAVSSGVEGLANAATSALGQSGPIGALLAPVVNALRDVWEGYFGSPIPPGGTNWNAYTHQQLHQMLWENADVGDVSAVADEWQRHGTALAGHATELRDQRTALQTNWTAQSAESATSRLGELGDRTSGISTRASTVHQAAQSAGDALATARHAMPPPPGDHTGQTVAAGAAGAGAGAAIGGLLGTLAGGIGAGPGALMGGAMGAVAAGGASMFLDNVGASAGKAQAVHVMQHYETSLHQSSKTISPTPAGATEAAVYGVEGAFGPTGSGGTTSASGFVGGGSGGGDGSTGRGVAWRHLVGSDALGARLGAGMQVGGAENAMVARNGLMSELAAARATNGGAMWPGGAARARNDEDDEHVNDLPGADHGIFSVGKSGSTPVIGL
ncbi:hypothetical protein F0L68_05090 [Solihabitans fulvus]|uniref:PPE family protein n=1 Tax=Solihabitans fulvus TaxID=1892852 RepID=A0A5B2XQ76_9PSEU|nr:hypothetical protein [Solihabitans fulvus]KAA2265225.1 hypothetical protein F0L68_05090 [Solihabitans fulvus]